jgi:hypothetical protein
MNIVKPVLTGMALAIAATLTFSATDSAVAKTKKHDDSAQTSEARPSDLGGSDRQLQGRFFKSSHKKHHKAAKSADAK